MDGTLSLSFFRQGSVGVREVWGTLRSWLETSAGKSEPLYFYYKFNDPDNSPRLFAEVDEIVKNFEPIPYLSLVGEDFSLRFVDGYDGFPWHEVSVSGKTGSEWLHTSLESLSQFDGFAIGGLCDKFYSEQQHCRHIDVHERHFGPTGTLPKVSVETVFGIEQQLDLSMNPGKVEVGPEGPEFVAAELWFSEEYFSKRGLAGDIAFPDWVACFRTAAGLRVKSYDGLFTSADGEQGKRQRVLWKLLFGKEKSLSR